METTRAMRTGALLVALTLGACGDPTSLGNDQIEGDWLIPKSQIQNGGPGRDGIPALVSPLFVNSSEVTYLSDDDLIIGLKIGGEIHAYPHAILDWHEIINDDIGQARVAVTYCPLTGSGIAWNGVLNGVPTTFGVSGLLYNSNLIPYDRSTNSYWSQMKLQSVNGALKGMLVNTYPIIETTWRTWKEMYPGSKVAATETGYSRPYGRYPYGDYKTSEELLFPVDRDDRRLPRKERTYGIVAGAKARVYRYGAFSDSLSLFQDDLGGVPLVVLGSRAKGFAVAFGSELSDGTRLQFAPVQDQLPIVMTDNEGSRWDAFGEAVDGPRKGTSLPTVAAFSAYWFAWGTFFPDADLIE